MDINDLEIYFQNFKKYIQNIDINNINNVFNNLKIPLILRFHQDLITHKIMNQIDKEETNFLLGAKARSGKTFCVAGLFVKYYKKYEKLNALIITPAPNETMSQFTEDVFHKYNDFNEINIVEIKSSNDLKNLILQKNNIIIISKQLIDDYINEKTINSIKELNLNFIVFDENHFHGTTKIAKNIIECYSINKTIHFYLTATFNKPLNEWSILEDNRFYWDIEDENFCKKRDIKSLIDKHGEDVLLFLEKDNKNNNENVLSIYDKMPELHIITNMMDIERYNNIKQILKDTSYGFSNSTLLSGQFPGEVDMILRYITGSHKEIDYPKKDLSIFNRIKSKCINENSRTLLNNGNFSTQLWFLPYGPGMTIKKVSEHLYDRMILNSVLKHYEIKIVNCSKKYKCKDIKTDIIKWELKAKKNGKNGLILLAGNQLTLGITLHYVDIVFLFNDILSCDVIIQMMYRCMTESSNNNDDEINDKPKRFGFVVDMNISRVLNTLSDYKIYKKDLNNAQKIQYIIENNLINIDCDLFQGNENKTDLIEKLLSIWKENPINHLKILLKKVEEMIIEMDTNDQQLLNNYFTKNLKDDKKINIKFEFNKDINQILPNGKNISKVINENDNDDNDDNDNNNNNDDDDNNNEIYNKFSINISLTRDILPFIIPLCCILTLHNNDNDILNMLNIIQNDERLFDIFEDQSFIWFSKTDIINLVKKLLYKYINKNSHIYNWVIQMKLSLQSLIDKPIELLEFINSTLKPKQKEKEELGEVFTPPFLIQELLDNLDKYYIKENNISIFTEKEFKWGDITGSGIGNFSVVLYIRLMEGLKEIIPNENKRKKHILQNMIYMSEINKKNIYICRQIFDINNQYNLNIYHGDALLLDPYKEWGIKKFDIILGNPPYNKGGIKSSSRKKHINVLNNNETHKKETIWTKFVEKSINTLKENGFLVFIHPLSFLRKGSSVHDLLLEKFIIWMKLWDNTTSSKIINGTIPISLYVLQNKLNTNKSKTEIISENKKLTTTSFTYLNKKYTIPLAYYSIFNKLIHFIEKNNCKLDINKKTVKSIGIKEPLPINYTINDKWGVDTYRIKDGIIVKKMIELHPDTNKQKLIIANKNSLNGIFIDHGKLGLVGEDKFYILGNNLELIKQILSFKICNIIIQYTKYRQDFLDSESFSYIPDLRKLNYTNINETEFYQLINLTLNEINEINNLPTINEYNNVDDDDDNSKFLHTKKNKTVKKRKT
jgi:hypothetical protein